MKLSAFHLAPALGCLEAINRGTVLKIIRTSVGCALFCGTGAFAATITSFTATPVSGNGFSTVINSNFDSGSARITNSSITCTNVDSCSGSVATFELLGSGLTAATPFTITIDGTSLAAATGTVLVGFRGLPGTGYNFNVASGAFVTAITPSGSMVPAVPGGNFDIVGILNFAMPGADTITLPSSFQIALGGAAPPQVPEPASAALLTAGFGALALIKLKRRV